MVTLYVKFISDDNSFEQLSEYTTWIYENYGLKTQYKLLEEEEYDIYFKNKLVKVI